MILSHVALHNVCAYTAVYILLLHARGRSVLDWSSNSTDYSVESGGGEVPEPMGSRGGGWVDSGRVGSRALISEPTSDMSGLAERRDVTSAPNHPLTPAHVFE